MKLNETLKFMKVSGLILNNKNSQNVLQEHEQNIHPTCANIFNSKV